MFKVPTLFIAIIVFTLTSPGDIARGYATWYDESWVKHPMASGLWFEPDRIEAAHRKLKFGSVVKVTSHRTKKSVTVVITDRGPYAKDENGKLKYWRIIDLTYAAAYEIGMIAAEDETGSGVAKVTVVLLKRGTCTSHNSCKKKPFKRGKKVEIKIK